MHCSHILHRDVWLKYLQLSLIDLQPNILLSFHAYQFILEHPRLCLAVCALISRRIPKGSAKACLLAFMELRMIGGSASPAPPGAVHANSLHQSSEGVTRPAASPASSSPAATPMGSIPQVGLGLDTRPITPSELTTGPLSSFNIVPIEPSADARN